MTDLTDTSDPTSTSIRQRASVGPIRPPKDPSTGVRHVKLHPHEMMGPVTAAEDLFILAHLGVPRVDPAQWSLVVDGLVGRTLMLDLDALKARPKRIVEAVHNCCGNPARAQGPDAPHRECPLGRHRSR